MSIIILVKLGSELAAGKSIRKDWSHLNGINTMPNVDLKENKGRNHGPCLEIWSRTICNPIKRIPSESYFENIFLTSNPKIYLLEMLITARLRGWEQRCQPASDSSYALH